MLSHPCKRCGFRERAMPSDWCQACRLVIWTGAHGGYMTMREAVAMVKSGATIDTITQANEHDWIAS
jgi:hypothetical protein